jgi:hypothetical protein
MKLLSRLVNLTILYTITGNTRLRFTEKKRAIKLAEQRHHQERTDCIHMYTMYTYYNILVCMLLMTLLLNEIYRILY